VGQFSKNPQYKELLAGVTFRAPDIVFDREATLDFGGVTARLMWMGAAYTLGDELIIRQAGRASGRHTT
jgi:hypothetical protein